MCLLCSENKARKRSFKKCVSGYMCITVCVNNNYLLPRFYSYSDRPFSIFQNVRDTQRNIPKDWDYFNIDQMNAPDLYQGM